MDWYSLTDEDVIIGSGRVIASLLIRRSFFSSGMDWYSLADEDVLIGSDRSG